MNAALARKLAFAALSRYWPRGAGPVESLALPDLPWPSDEPLPPVFERVPLPDWAGDLGVDGALLVPAHRIAAGKGDVFGRTDWLGAACWFIHAVAERAHESRHGPIHSYSFRLRGWDGSLWDYAWANRIALFLRRWAAYRAGVAEEALFGPLPRADILLTHDIDAVSMTWALRFKQASFHCFNAVKQLARGRPAIAASKLTSALRFAGRRGDLLHLEEVASRARDGGIRSHFFVYGGNRNRSLKLWLVDPQYDIAQAGLGETLRKLNEDGFQVGLHQSYDSWRDARAMSGEKTRVEDSARVPVESCRQHWLRFSWADTWEAQGRAGFRLDATLGFNDRPGFRNGAALRMRPLNAARDAELALESVPMILMDSQLYDYEEHDDSTRQAEMERWLGEVASVRGVASVIWHPHTLGPEYGWQRGFSALLDCIKAAH